MLRIAKYGMTRHWALYDEDALVVVTVYKKGAEAVQRRLEDAEQALHEAIRRTEALRWDQITRHTSAYVAAHVRR